MANVIDITVRAQDKASAQLRGIQDQTSKLGSMMGTALKAGALAGGAALAGAGVAAVKMGMDFGKGMAEVKTLLPDLSKKAFGKLKGDVLGLSKQMGIATSEMVPALYQAISAGVPPENVIDFLRTGAKASIGGVTDLGTAVDGLTTVVNAFGLSSEDTGRVADVMFTAVKLGKTTMAELSSSMFQAAPLAASLGLSIEDVAAATATLTKSGTPTSVAMTQIRQAMVSMSKPNKDMNELLEKTGYESGEALLKSEGFAGALGILTKAAEGDTEAMGKAFGSVEALQAVLGLTGENAETAAADLAAMGEATGAADAAFKTMADTASYKLNKAINIVKVTLTELGAKALPVIIKGFEAVGRTVSTFIKGFTAGFKEADVTSKGFFGTAERIGKAARELFEDALPHLEEFGRILLDIAKVVFPIIRDALETYIDAWQMLYKNVLEPFIIPILKKVGEFLLEHKPLLIALAGAILLLTNPWLAVAAAIVIVLAKWDEISKMFTKTIPDAITGVINKIRELPIIGAIFEDAWNTAKAIVETAFQLIANRVEFYLDTIKNAFAFWKAIFTGDWEGAWNALKAQAGAIWDLIKGDFGALLDGFKAILGSKLEMLKTVGADIARAIGDGLRSALGWARGAMNALITIIEKGVNTIIDLINAIPNVSLPFGLGSIGIPDIPRVSIPRLQAGTPFFRGGAAILGEGGPEMAILPRGSRVLNAGQTAQAMAPVAISDAGAAAIAEAVARELPRALENVVIELDGNAIGQVISRQQGAEAFMRSRGG